MILLGNFLLGMAEVIRLILNAYMLLLLVRVILSWTNPDPYNPLVRFIENATEPPMRWIRRRVRLVFGQMDFAPLLLLIILVFLQTFLVGTLAEYGVALKR